MEVYLSELPLFAAEAAPVSTQSECEKILVAKFKQYMADLALDGIATRITSKTHLRNLPKIVSDHFKERKPKSKLNSTQQDFKNLASIVESDAPLAVLSVNDDLNALPQISEGTGRKIKPDRASEHKDFQNLQELVDMSDRRSRKGKVKGGAGKEEKTPEVAPKKLSLAKEPKTDEQAQRMVNTSNMRSAGKASAKKREIDDGNFESQPSSRGEEDASGAIDDIDSIQLSIQEKSEPSSPAPAKQASPARNSNQANSAKRVDRRKTVVEKADSSEEDEDENDEDFICVPASNLNKESVTFYPQDKLIKMSLMMSEVSNHPQERLNSERVSAPSNFKKDKGEMLKRMTSMNEKVSGNDKVSNSVPKSKLTE